MRETPQACTEDAGARSTADSLLRAAQSRAAGGEEFAAANLVSRAQERFALDDEQWARVLTVFARLRFHDAALAATARGITTWPQCPWSFIAHTEALRMSGRQAEALDSARAASDRFRTIAAAWAARGRLEVLAGQYASATASFSTARSLQPGYFQLRPEFELWQNRAERALAGERP